MARVCRRKLECGPYYCPWSLHGFLSRAICCILLTALVALFLTSPSDAAGLHPSRHRHGHHYHSKVSWQHSEPVHSKPDRSSTALSTFLSLFPWIFGFFSCMVLLAMTMYELISLSDLENDYINTRQLAKRLSWVLIPHIAFHAIVTFFFLFSFKWIFFLLNAPLLAYNARQFMRNQHLIDETEVFKDMKHLQQVRFYKIAFYTVMVLLLMIRLIFAAFD